MTDTKMSVFEFFGYEKNKKTEYAVRMSEKSESLIRQAVRQFYMQLAFVHKELASHSKAGASLSSSLGYFGSALGISINQDQNLVHSCVFGIFT